MEPTTNPEEDPSVISNQNKQQKGKPGVYKGDDTFSNIFHAETMLLSDTLLKTNRAALLAKEGSPMLESVSLPPRSKTDKLESNVKILPVSQRCCPVYSGLLRDVQFTQESEIL
jgi:hypothetical protein